MPDYDRQQFNPPAPIARLTIRTPDRARSIADVIMLVDSGADVTLIPRVFAERLALDCEIDPNLQLEGFTGGTAVARTVRAELVFLGKNFRGRFPLIDEDYGILGRNVLNNLSLLLDGPRLAWREATNRD